MSTHSFSVSPVKDCPEVYVCLWWVCGGSLPLFVGIWCKQQCST